MDIFNTRIERNTTLYACIVFREELDVRTSNLIDLYIIHILNSLN